MIFVDDLPEEVDTDIDFRIYPTQGGYEVDNDSGEPMYDENGVPMEGSDGSSNPSTGIALASMPAIIAAACALISKKQ